MSHKHITTPAGHQLAYRQIEARPGQASFVWLSGFKSDMSGTKVLALESWAQATGHGFLAFDYSGHGVSSGAFEEGTISVWRQYTLDVLDMLTRGPQILVGSSMGGWMALLAALARPERVSALVLIAPAPDFTEKLMWPEFSKEAQDQILQKGLYLRPSEYGEPYPITKALIEDGRNWQILDAAIAFKGPVRILQGMQDEDVPWSHAARLIETVQSEDLTFTLIKDGDHRLSREEDIQRLLNVCEEITGPAGT